MAHNVSKEKQAQIERERLVAELEPYLVPGWQIDRIKGRIVAVPTVLGHYQRGQQLLLRCREHDCRRRIEVDLRLAIEAGLGDRPVKDLATGLRCGHWAGCGLEEHSAIYPKGVPLVGYLGERSVMIGITCGYCSTRTLLTPREVIRRLKEAGQGDGNTGVIALGRVIRGPCRKCHRREFTTAVVNIDQKAGLK